ISFWFIFFDAEDQGGINGWDWCEGSKWMINDMKNQPDVYFRNTQSLESINSFILLDMVGGDNLKFIHESHDSNKLRQKVFVRQFGNC
ncbi:unnamed protein product, partial [marine sediment metagenome]